MPDACTYPAAIERDENGRYAVTFADFGWGAIDGAKRDEAKDLLRELITATNHERTKLPKPSCPGRKRPRSPSVTT